jgi:hypothetical protein
MINGTLTPLQLNAGSALLQNQGIVIGRDLTTAEAAYSATPLMTAFFSALSNYGNIATLGANSVPAFSNSVPAAYSTLGTQMTIVVNAQAYKDLGSGDVSKFVQAFNIATAYIENTNLFINSAVISRRICANKYRFITFSAITIR